MHPDFESVAIGGRDIRYICRGQGAVTVVFEQGQGISIEEEFCRRIVFGWPKVFAAIQATTRVFMYDRAGLGWSDAAHEPRTSRDVANDLHAVLHSLALPPPYLLVGHDIGGFVVRQYVSDYPEEVAGVVLLDSAHPDQQSRLSHLLPPPPEFPRREILSLHCLRPNPKNPLPGGIDFAKSAEQIRSLQRLERAPVTVVSRDFAPRSGTLAEGLELEAAVEIERIWSELQTALLDIAAESNRIVAKASRHDVTITAPRVVVDTILNMLERIQSSSIAESSAT